MNNTTKKVLLIIFANMLLIAVIVVANLLTIGKLKKTAKLENEDLTHQYETVEPFIKLNGTLQENAEKLSEDVHSLVNTYYSETNDVSLLSTCDELLRKLKFKTSSVSLNDSEDTGTTMYIDGEEYNCQVNSVSVTFTATQKSLFKFVKMIKKNKMHMAIESITLSPDSESNEVSGSLTLSAYTITGSERGYNEPKYKGKTGVDNLFN